MYICPHILHSLFKTKTKKMKIELNEKEVSTLTQSIVGRLSSIDKLLGGWAKKENNEDAEWLIVRYTKEKYTLLELIEKLRG